MKSALHHAILERNVKCLRGKCHVNKNIPDNVENENMSYRDRVVSRQRRS